MGWGMPKNIQVIHPDDPIITHPDDPIVVHPDDPVVVHPSEPQCSCGAKGGHCGHR